MGLLTEIFGKANNSDLTEVAAAEAALAKLRRARGLAKAEIDQAGEKRKALLLVDDLDKEIARLDEAVQAAELKLDRLAEAEPKLLADLAAARDRARREQFAEMRGRGLAAAAKFLASARIAGADYEAYFDVLREAHAAGFASEAMHMMPAAPFTILPDHLNAFDRAFEEKTRLKA